MNLKIQDVSFGYKKNNLLREINLSISSGEVVAILGKNGSGKTTLLKIICGFLYGQSGKIFQDEKEVKEDGIYSGIIETPNFWEHMTGTENLRYYLEKEFSNEKIEWYANKWNLTHMLNKPVREYSLGMKQKLALILSFASNRKVLLFDEPINSLDQPSVDMFYECVMKAKSEGKIVIMTTHIVYELSKYCDSIYIIHEGKLSKYCPSYEEYIITYANNEGALKAAEMLNDFDIIRIDNSSLYVRTDQTKISDIVRKTSANDIIGVMQNPLTFDMICNEIQKNEGGKPK